jgi:hypothetical protein
LFASGLAFFALALAFSGQTWGINLVRTLDQLSTYSFFCVISLSTMFLRLIKSQARICMTARCRSTMILLIFTWFLFQHLPSPPVTQNNTRADRPPPKYRIEDRARFFYKSPFREEPDVEYETKLSESLDKVERYVLSQNRGNRISEDSIWQIAISQKAKEEDLRGNDSLEFEYRNSEWIYNVSSKPSHN